MKRVLLAFMAVAVLGVAHADNLRSKIASVDQQLHHAFMHRNVKEFETILKKNTTKDFKYTEDGNSLTFDQMLAGMKQGFSQMTKMTSQSTTLTSLKEKGDMASGTSEHSMSWIQKDDKHKTHKYVFTGKSADTFRKVNGKWLMSSMAWKTEKVTMDGKAVPMGGGGK